ncbi:MAG: cupin domain-containing protein, partial [Gammaproteobacteria bacterium]|nr:cupin domain-containing protein [Gammaproteobacteria bacterium]
TNAAAQSAVPVEQEPAHHLVLQNDQVRVFHVRLPAGAASLWHVHTHDGISVRIGDATIQDEPLGGPAQTFELHRGAVSFGATPAVYTHRVNNVGTTPFDNVYIELLGGTGTGNRDAAAPAARRPAEFENERVRVLRRVLAPGEATEMHTHPANAVAVVVTPGTLQVTQADGTMRALEPQAGAVLWVAAGTTHALRNMGSAAVEIVDVELN